MPLCHVAYHDMCGCFTYRTRIHQTHQLANSPVHCLKLLLFILQKYSRFFFVLARIQAEKQVNRCCFGPFTSFVLSVFKSDNCVLHHFSFLVWWPTRFFSAPNYARFAPKIPLFNGCFGLFSHVFHGLKRFYLYNCSGFLCFSLRIQLHFALRFVAFQLAFSGKMHYVQQQNAVLLVANSPNIGVNGRVLKYLFILAAIAAHPFLQQNQPSRESIICVKVGDW